MRNRKASQEEEEEEEKGEFTINLQMWGNKIDQNLAHL
jgi:hypothetical protein